MEIFWMTSFVNDPKTKTEFSLDNWGEIRKKMG